MTPRSRIASVYLLGFAIDLANMFVVNAAYPALQHALPASVAQLAWVGNTYMFGLVVVIPVGIWLSRRFGERRLLVASLALFVLASAGAACAPSIATLLLFRLLQGLSGGLLIPVGQAIAYRAYPPVERARLTSIVMLVALLVPALSPLIGGIVVDDASWRWIFLGMLPPAAFTCALALAWLPADEAVRDVPKLDIRGLVLCATALLALLFGLTLVGWSDMLPWAFMSLCFSFIAVLAYIQHANRTEMPLLNLKLLERPLLRISILVYLCVPGVFTGVNLIASLYFQNELGMNATNTGALMVPWTVASSLAVMSTRRLFSKLGPRPLFASGILIDCAGILMLATPLSTFAAARIVAFVAIGFGASLCTSTSQSAVFSDVPIERMGDTSALWNINRQLSFCFGTAALLTMLNGLLSLQIGGSGQLPYRACFLVAAVLTAIPLPFVACLEKGTNDTQLSHRC